MTSLDNYLSSVPWGGKNAKKETENKEIMEANTMRVKQNGSELSHLDASNFEGTTTGGVLIVFMSSNFLLEAAEDDYLELVVEQAHPGGATGTSNAAVEGTWMSVVRLGAS